LQYGAVTLPAVETFNVGVTTASLPKEAVSYYEASEVSVVFSVMIVIIIIIIIMIIIITIIENPPRRSSPTLRRRRCRWCSRSLSLSLHTHGLVLRYEASESSRPPHFQPKP
jgi:hypothetical protein